MPVKINRKYHCYGLSFLIILYAKVINLHELAKLPARWCSVMDFYCFAIKMQICFEILDESYVFAGKIMENRMKLYSLHTHLRHRHCCELRAAVIMSYMANGRPG